MCEWFDQTCGALLDRLEKKGIADNTIVIYVTDNGWIQRTPKTDVPPKWRSAFAPRSKQSPYEGGVRTPIMIRWPARLKPRVDKTTLVSSIDLAPTILSSAEIKPAGEMTGVNLIPVCIDPKSMQRRLVWGEIFSHDMPDLNQPLKGLLYRWAIRDFDKIVTHHRGTLGRYVWGHQRDSFETQMYNLKSDPHERKNIAAQDKPRVQQLENLLNKASAANKLIKVQLP